jgi:hypothetical protein
MFGLSHPTASLKPATAVKDETLEFGNSLEPTPNKPFANFNFSTIATATSLCCCFLKVIQI